MENVNQRRARRFREPEKDAYNGEARQFSPAGFFANQESVLRASLESKFGAYTDRPSALAS